MCVRERMPSIEAAAKATKRGPLQKTHHTGCFRIKAKIMQYLQQDKLKKNSSSIKRKIRTMLFCSFFLALFLSGAWSLFWSTFLLHLSHCSLFWKTASFDILLCHLQQPDHLSIPIEQIKHHEHQNTIFHSSPNINVFLAKLEFLAFIQECLEFLLSIQVFLDFLAFIQVYLDCLAFIQECFEFLASI